LADRTLRKAAKAVVFGTQASFADPIVLAVRAIPRWRLLDLGTWILGAAALASGMIAARQIAPRTGGIRAWPPSALVLAAALGVWGFCHIIFLFSGAVPNSIGFDSRVQVAIRFVVSVVWALVLLALALRMGRWRAVPLCVLVVAFAMSMKVQRDAWIDAAGFNARVVEAIVERAPSPAVWSATSSEPYTIFVHMPKSFPGAFNHEPIFAVHWDLTAALQQRWQAPRLRAAVLGAMPVTVDERGVEIEEVWRAPFPFLFYDAIEGRAEVVRSRDDWNAILASRS
jgi:hypothetical protein